MSQISDSDMHIYTGSVDFETSKSDEVVASSVVKQEQNLEESPQTSSEDSNARKRCIFCDQQRKRLKGHYQTLHVCGSEDVIKSLAEVMNDLNLIAKINDACEKNQIILYHNVCKLNYEYQLESQIAANKPKSKWHILRAVHKIAYDEVCSYIREHVIGKKSCFLLNFFIRLYVDTLREAREEYEREDLSINLEANCHLEEKLLQTFPKEITIVTLRKKKIVKPCTGVLLKGNDLDALEKQDILQRAALILRREINEIEHQPLPDQLKMSDLIKGECILPTSLRCFYETVLNGPNYRRKSSANSKRFTESFSADLIYASGKLKPSKHITLGLAIKGLTNSKNIVNILNKYGHCCSYTSLEELETEATFASGNRLEICPEDILRTTNLCTGLAFDNFECFADTLSGKDTLHDTVGIIYQNIDTAQNNSDVRENIATDIRPEGSTKRRRTYDTESHELESYAKKTTIS